MKLYVLSAVALVVGVALGWLVGSRPVAASRQRATQLAADLAAARADTATLTTSLTDTFKVQAREILDAVVAANRDHDATVQHERDRTLAATLSPLQQALADYQKGIEEFERRNLTQVGDVKAAAEKLTELQTATMQETRRLSTLLGRSQERGRWGESQLYRILELSGLLPRVDFAAQATMATAGGRQRPDAVVHLPNTMSIAIDSKAPYEAFDAAMASDNDADRERLLKDYAKALRGHVLDLSKKAYWDGLELSPQFVVCFVPSDHLLAAAFSADPTLLEAGLAGRVLVAGPTTLMGMLWSVALGWQQFSLQTNMEAVVKLAQRLVDRAGVAYGHLDKMGRTLNSLSTSYGQLVGSLEGSLFVTIRDMSELAVPTADAASLAPRDVTTTAVRALDPTRWPAPVDGDALATNPEALPPA